MAHFSNTRASTSGAIAKQLLGVKSPPATAMLLSSGQQRTAARHGATIFPSHVRRCLAQNPTTTSTTYGGDLVRLLDDIAHVTNTISAYVSARAETGGGGGLGPVKSGLDPSVATWRLYKALTHDGYACLILDRNTEIPLTLPKDEPIGQYVIAVSPLDMDTTLSTEHSVCGTIFSVYKRRSLPSLPGAIVDIQQKTQNQVAAGYVTYSSATTLYYTLGRDHGAYSFCLHPVATQYFLKPSTPLRIPDKCPALHGNRNQILADDWLGPALQHYCRSENGSPPRMFDSGTVTANFHAVAIHGGVVVHYNCHLLCEAAPLSLIIEQLGGMAISGDGDRILDLTVHNEDIHQTVTLIAGVKSVVQSIRRAIKTSFDGNLIQEAKSSQESTRKLAKENGKV
jgi:fructose-1,6-bisphosphatase I